MSCGLPTLFKSMEFFIYSTADAVSMLSLTHGFVWGTKWESVEKQRIPNSLKEGYNKNKRRN